MTVTAKHIRQPAEPNNAGEFQIRQGDGYCGMEFVCPCGCGDKSWIPMYREKRDAGNDHRWKWDGNEDRPTLSPSLQKTGGCRWHGYLKAGIFEEC